MPDFTIYPFNPVTFYFSSRSRIIVAIPLSSVWLGLIQTFVTPHSFAIFSAPPLRTT